MSKDLSELSREYTDLCAKLGDLEFKRHLIVSDINKIKQKIKELNKKAAEAKGADNV